MGPRRSPRQIRVALAAGLDSSSDLVARSKSHTSALLPPPSAAVERPCGPPVERSASFVLARGHESTGILRRCPASRCGSRSSSPSSPIQRFPTRRARPRLQRVPDRTASANMGATVDLGAFDNTCRDSDLSRLDDGPVTSSAPTPQVVEMHTAPEQFAHDEQRPPFIE